ncbi:MAG TPA: hypothetical protein P5205_10505 [Candidatus Paceibacterota bacterium]|nr:hypothetical protein [Verrucomicrobiota bacterium]HSA10786.1 hypothetical protein [Candidatus Paceibacterota bacterium]
MSPINEVCNEGKGWLQVARNTVGKGGCEAYAVLRYFSGSNTVLVRMRRYRSREDIGDAWGKDKDTRDAPGSLPNAGEETRFYQRDGMHKDIAFRRGNYLITVEGMGAPLEKLKQLAEALDDNLVRAESGAGRSQAAATQFVAEGSVEYHNSWAAEDVSKRPGFPPVVSRMMNFSVVVSNSCYLLRLEPAKESAVLYHEAGFDGKTLCYLSRMNLSSPQNAPGVRASRNVATAWIYHHQQVVHSLFAHEMGPVWLMFASGHYLRSVTNGLIEPPLTLGLFENDDYFPRPFTIPAQWTLQPAFPFLPVAVTCRDDGETKTAPPFQNAKRAPPFDAGFTNIIYRVTDTQEFEGVWVPSAAVLETYRVETRGKPELRPYTRYRLTLKKWLRGIPPTCFRPKLPGPTTISDTRSFGVPRGKSVLTEQWPAE